MQVHQITRAEMDEIRRTEGGGGNKSLGYFEEDVPCRLYDGQLVTGVALLAHPYCKFRTGKAGLPSERYLKMLRRGAQQFGLHQSYSLYLDNLQGYSADTWGKRMGARLMQSCVMPILVNLFRYVLPRAKPYPWLRDRLAYVPDFILAMCWVVHDWLLCWLLGSGR